MTSRRPPAPPPDLHAVPYQAGSTAHTADRTCECSPRPYRDLLEPARVVGCHPLPLPRAARLLVDSDGADDWSATAAISEVGPVKSLPGSKPPDPHPAAHTPMTISLKRYSDDVR